MTSQKEIWTVLQAEMRRDDWMPLDDIYELVARRVPSTQDDLALRWRRNVRNVLQRRKAAGDVQWNGHGAYRLVK